MRANIVYSRYLFLFAGLSGLLILLPFYFLEDFLSRNDPPPITHPEFYYGFVGVAVACQLLFLVIAADPVRFRPMMIPAMVEKATYGVAVMVLWSQGRISAGPVLGGAMDLTLGVLFAVSFVALRNEKWVR
ncbi:MAG: hypothetical protein AB7O59_17275 [Pirellulales bacterium]